VLFPDVTTGKILELELNCTFWAIQNQQSWFSNFSEGFHTFRERRHISRVNLATFFTSISKREISAIKESLFASQ